jgi:hypothetical protein
MTDDLEGFVKLAPAVWPGAPLRAQPGDLSLFAPMGNGVGASLVVLPWDSARSVAARGSYYGFHPHSGHPFLGAPITECGGGTVYFAGDCERADFEVLLRMMGVEGRGRQFAAFARAAEDPGQEGYLTQLRLVSGFALKHMFGVREDPQFEALTAQSSSVLEVLWRFVEHFTQRHRAGDYDLDGALGGDGDWASEQLGFGLMVENEYHSIYRIWTRAWLVTK